MRRQFMNIYDEYDFLKLKVAKLKMKWDNVGIVEQKRLMKKARQFIKRMLEISEFLKVNGYEDPEAIEAKKTAASIPSNLPIPQSPHLYQPDGSLTKNLQEKIDQLKQQRESEKEVE